MAFVSCFIALAIVAFQDPAGGPAGNTVREAVAGNAATIAKIKSIHVRAEVSQQFSGRAGGRGRDVETWRSGNREREAFRYFAILSPNGPVAGMPKEGRLRFSGFDARETRRLEGWDPAHPPRTPLDAVVDPKSFSMVRCSIAPRNPEGETSSVWKGLLLEFDHGQSLRRIVESAVVVPVDSTNSDAVRFELRQSTDPHLVGTIIELDGVHGFMISRIEFKSGAVARVVEFSSYADGIWLPACVERMSNGTGTILKVIDCEVNQDISDGDLRLDFPEGARVDQPDESKIHIWGAGKPRLTFSNMAEFDNHMIEQAKAAGRENRSVRPVPLQWVLWANLALVISIAALLYLRKRFR